MSRQEFRDMSSAKAIAEVGNGPSSDRKVRQPKGGRSPRPLKIICAVFPE